MRPLGYSEQATGGRASDDAGVVCATAIQHGNDVGRTDRAVSAGDLVAVEAGVLEQIRGVVLNVGPLEFAHSELGRELEGTFTREAFGDETLEGVFTHEEPDFVWRGGPARVDTAGIALRGSDRNERLNERGDASDDSRRTQGALVDAELDTTVRNRRFPRLTAQRGFSIFNTTRRESDKDFLDASLGTEFLDDVGTTDELVMHASGAVLEHFTEESLAVVAGELVESLEGQTTDVGLSDVGERYIDLGLTARKALRERYRTGVTSDKLHARAGVKIGADVGVDKIKHQLLEGIFSGEIAATESGVAVFDGDTGTDTALGTKSIAVLGIGDLFGGEATSFGDRSGGRESRDGQGIRG